MPIGWTPHDIPAALKVLAQTKHYNLPPEKIPTQPCARSSTMADQG